jgi:hypothetical protein
MRAERRVEPWPLALAGLLALMISVCGVLYAVAATHVDPEVASEARPGVVAHAGAAEAAP